MHVFVAKRVLFIIFLYLIKLIICYYLLVLLAFPFPNLNYFLKIHFNVLNFQSHFLVY